MTTVPTDAEEWDFLRDLNRVGPSKPVSYLPLRTIRRLAKRRSEAVAADAKRRGLSAIQCRPDHCHVQSGALYVYDPKALAGILGPWAGLLVRYRIPRHPRRFIVHIAHTFYERPHPASMPIAVAFGESLPVRTRHRLARQSARYDRFVIRWR